jgi:small nuclear ribonucleoprotein (snRNP)-like protein
VSGTLGAENGSNSADFGAVIGTLKGYDQLMNLVLDEVKEALTGMYAPYHTPNHKLTWLQTTKATSATANSA